MRSSVLMAPLAAMALALPAAAHSGAVADADSAAAPGRAPIASTPKQRAAQLFFSERPLLTQRAEQVSFYSDVLRDRVVLINFIYTRCTDACPTQTALLAAVQPLLGDALGPTFRFVSISVDPEHDTPAALAEYAARFGARDGWLFLTGSKRDVDDVVRRRGELAAAPQAHTTLFILGNPSSGHWIKLHPDSAPSDIAQRLRALAAERVAGDDGVSH
jgi:cytochrome oxidase Cu insertion factor (SCO1/SenC/PrrC family)